MLPLVAAALASDLRELPAVGGRTLLLWEDHRAPVVEVTAHFPMGYVHAGWPEHGGIYWSAVPDCTRGGGVLRSTRARSGPTRSTLTLRADSERLDALAEIFARIVGGPLDCVGSDAATALDRVREEAMAVPAFRLLVMASRSLFSADDARRDFAEAHLAEYLDVREAESLRDRVVALAGAVVTFAGDCDAACARTFVGRAFPSPATGARPPIAPARAVPRPAPRIEDTRADLPQLHLGVARLSPGTLSPDWPAFLVVDALAEGRLHEALREREGLVYAAFTDVRVSPWPEPWMAWTMVRPAGEDAVVAGLHAVLDGLAAEGATPSELERTRAKLRRGRLPDAPTERLAARAEVLVAGDAWLARDTALDLAEALPLAAVNAFAHRFLAPDARTDLRLAPE